MSSRSRAIGAFGLIAALLLATPSPLSAQTRDAKMDMAVSILKGPSGIAAEWLMSDPPAIPGAALTFSTASGADLVTAKLLSGEIDVAVLPINLAAKLYNSGARIRAVAVVGGGMVRFLTSDPSLNSPADLRGKSIAIAGQKATPDYLFRFLMDREGLKAQEDYTASYNLAYPEAAAALAAGRISQAVLPEPFATQALLLAPGLRSPIDLDSLWTAATGLKGYPMSLLVVSSILADSNPKGLRIFLDAYRASVAKTVAQPEATGKLAESLDLGMKAAIAAAAIPKSNYKFEEMAEARPELEGLLGIFLGYEPASIGGKLPDSGFYASIPARP